MSEARALLQGSLLEVDALDAFYGDFQALFGVSMRVEAGAIVAVIGANGAGKSTLLKSIAGLMGARADAIRFDGAAIGGGPAYRTVARGIARSFQIPQPFGGMTVFENTVVAAAFGQGKGEHDVYASCIEILERCGLAAKANRLAGSLTLIDRKRLELARALATRPRVLLLDEVAGGLTEHECASLVSLIKEVRAGGVSIVWIEHVVHALIAVVDRLAVLHAGAIIASGDPHAVIKSPQVAEIYLGIEADV